MTSRIMSCFNIKELDLSPLCHDYDLEIRDMDELIELVSRLVLGHCRHVSRIISGLAPNYPNIDSLTINDALEKLTYETIAEENSRKVKMEKIHGWLFQMISWIALAELNGNRSGFYQFTPHSQPSMHGLDGIAVTLKKDKCIDRIIITEDKCTQDDRYTIREKVFPEFIDIESGIKNNAIMQHVGLLIKDDDIYTNIQNDIVKPELRQYRIGITRQALHNSVKKRKDLYKDYDKFVTGEDDLRRTASSIFFDDVRYSMEQIRQMVIDCIRRKA